MGIIVTLRDIIALSILGLGLLGLLYLYLHHKYTNWRRARREDKKTRQLQQALIDSARNK
jgi:hypothetical protein